MKRLALFLSGAVAGICFCYVAVIAAVWRHLTHTRGAKHEL